MTRSLSTNLATHYAFIEKEDRTIPLTKEMAETLRERLKNVYATQYITIAKLDDPLGEPEWEGRAGDVRIQKNKITANAGDRWVCDYATRHSMNDHCDCRFSVSPGDFRAISWELFKKYPIKLTLGERQHILSKYS